MEWDVDCEPGVAAWSDPEAVLIQNANSERIRQAMAELPFEYRKMLILRELEELSDKEIAERHSSGNRYVPAFSSTKGTVLPARPGNGEGAMNCQEVSGLLDAYLDKELDFITSSKFDRHLTDCPACRATSDRYRQMHQSVKAQMEYFQAPEEFAQRLRVGLCSSGQAEEKTTRRGWFPRWWAWPMAASLIAVSLLTVMLLQMFRRSASSDLLAEQVVSSHIRSLLADH